MANPNSRGQQRDKPFRDALRLEIAAAQNDNDLRSLRRIARSLLEAAAEGKVDAIKEIADRLDGRVPQAVELDGEIRHTISDRPMTPEEWAAQFTADDGG